MMSKLEGGARRVQKEVERRGNQGNEEEWGFKKERKRKANVANYLVAVNLNSNMISFLRARNGV